MATPLMMQVTRLIQSHQPDGISPHLQLALIFHGRGRIISNDHDVYPRSGEKQLFRMPNLASQWDTLSCKQTEIRDHYAADQTHITTPFSNEQMRVILRKPKLLSKQIASAR